jgi:tight adherence protein B
MFTTPTLIVAMGGFLTLIVLYLAFAGPSTAAAHTRRLNGIKERHSSHGGINVEAQMRRIISTRVTTRSGEGLSRLIPDPAMIAKKLAMTGRDWKLKQFVMTCAGLAAIVMMGMFVKGAPLLLAILVGCVVGVVLPNLVVNFFIGKRIRDFTTRFPDAIELMVRGLRSGLPISETLGIVGSEIPGPVGVEFRGVCDRIKIGRSMDEALQETAVRLGTPEFQFFCITLNIQRETGGNLAETLSNLADVLRKRAQMKLKIKAMSSESKASAYIVGSLPFIVFAMVWFANPEYLAGFFFEERLIIAGVGGLTWMSIGVFIMAKMVSFEI